MARYFFIFVPPESAADGSGEAGVSANVIQYRANPVILQSTFFHRYDFIAKTHRTSAFAGCAPLNEDRRKCMVLKAERMVLRTWPLSPSAFLPSAFVAFRRCRVISCERWKDGFLLTVEGLRVLRHSSSFPSLHVLVPKERKGFAADPGKGKSPRMAWQKLGPCELHNESAERIVLDFPGVCRFRLAYSGRILELGFEKADESLQGLKLSLGADAREVLFGAGPSADYNLKRSIVDIPAPGPDDDNARIPAVFSSLGTWLHVATLGELSLRFHHSRTEMRCSAFPVELALGFGKDPLTGMELLTRYRAQRDFPGGKGVRLSLPDEMIERPLVDARNSRDTGIIEKALAAAGLSPILRVDAVQSPPAEPGAAFGELFAMEGEKELSESIWSALRDSSCSRVLRHPADHPAGARELVRAILSLSFSGTGHAILPVGDPDGCAMLELAAFGPVFLIETAACLEGQAALHGLMASAAMYGMLHPYRRQCAELWRRTGIPFWHHPAMRYPGESGLWDLDDQFMSGPDLLIAPRTGASKGNEGTCRRICLPDDEWIHLWTSRKYRKGWTVVADPPGKPAVFYRARSPFAGLFDELRKKATRF
jgi:hypothetical protein